MKKILVPTDFSHCSLKALDYAIDMANKSHAEIILVWVNSDRIKEALFHLKESTIEGKATAQFNKIIPEYLPKLASGKMSYRIREGKVHIEVTNQAKYDDVDLVICGTHGSSGFEENYVGSNAYRIVMYCKCPVITVRPNYERPQESKILVLPIDGSSETRQKVQFTCKLAKILGMEIHVVGIHSSKLSSLKRKVDNYTAQTADYVLHEHIKHIVTFKEGSNVTKTALAYAISVDADLVSITTEQESSTFSFLLGTYAEQMIGLSQIPVLSITPKVLTASFLS